MNSPNDTLIDTHELPSSDAVANYLRAHLDFFTNHPAVLHDLEIAHTTGGTVSLLERQVVSLRQDNERLKSRFEELLSLAKSNEDLILRIHQLAISLMEAVGPEAIFSTLNDRLAREFQADSIRTVILAEAGSAAAQDIPEFVGRDFRGRDAFAQILADRMPKCGVLNDAQLAAVFGDAISPAGSSVVLPLVGKHWDGFVIISSNDANRFNENMSTEFLAYLGDIVSLTVDPWVARAPSV